MACCRTRSSGRGTELDLEIQVERLLTSRVCIEMGGVPCPDRSLYLSIPRAPGEQPARTSPSPAETEQT